MICDVDPVLVINNILVRVKSGQEIQDFRAQDWIEVFGLSEDEIIWDNVQSGLEIVFAHDENVEKVSSEIVSGMKEVRRLYECFRVGEISEVDFLYESEWICLDAVVKILASYLGGAPINIEVLGIVINGEVLNMRYTAVKDRIRGEWDSALKRYEEEQRSYNELLEKRYADYIKWLKRDLDTYMEILPRVFSGKPEEALAGSAELTRFLKLPRAKVLGSLEDVDSFFLD